MTEARTARHLATARANRTYALTILHAENTLPAAMNWAAVATFYSAMHLVNGYLWEVARLEPRSHLDREMIILRWPDLASHSEAYRHLLDYSVRARYTPGYQIHQSDLVLMLNRHLATIARAIEQTLEDQP